MFWIWRKCLSWFGNLPLKSKLYISFGWMGLFTIVLGAVCLGGVHTIRQIGSQQMADPQAAGAVTPSGSSDRAASLEQATDRVEARFQSVILGLLAFIVCIDLVMAWRLVHLIGDPIVNACEVLDRLSNRDLTVTALVESKDEVGRMGAALNRTILHLHDILKGLKESAVSLEKVAGDLGDQTSLTSGNCRRQVELAGAVLSSTRLMAERGAAIAQNSHDAALASRESAVTANSGSQVMASAAQTMGEVSTSSSRISELMGRLDLRSREISKVVIAIREISDKTNLLALNAAIEAARAGEQGRGFAVVASEVRRLAEHTRAATEEIVEMVGSIQQETASTTAAVESNRDSIENGQQRTGEAHRMLTQIIQRASQTETLAEETAKAINCHSSSCGEIAASAAQVAELASASLHASDEAAKTGSVMLASAKHLAEVVSRFKLQEDAPAAARAV